ncbi:MAG: hypothetical protein KKC76_01705 [Proteobacteria bacterium]|nr:hypothetical protein [Pseudomonadota bacterium]MBU4294896.1 hypothetical protein [Pseudomonadota bacterium]MCG2750129.1 hypothetical protein [Desulfobulbaceae bacterium]
MTCLISQTQQTASRYFYSTGDADRDEAKSTIVELQSLESIAGDKQVMAADRIALQITDV